MKLQIKATHTPSPKAKPSSDQPLPFGVHFTDHLFAAEWSREAGWHNARIEPYQNLQLDPAAAVLHYGQALFEGLKAFRQEGGHPALFRPEMHAQRMSKGAARLCMPELPPSLFLEGVEVLVRTEVDWIPTAPGTALYLRPTFLATEPFLGVRPSGRYLFFVIASPVGAYYAKGFHPVRIWVETEQVRAARGGLGAVKAPANYAASFFATERAKAGGYDQVLWLDSQHRAYVEEVGTMNLFAVFGQTLVTPPLSDSLLPGVTRTSVLTLAREWGLTVEERPLALREMLDGAENGTLTEVFGTGTAAVISAVGELATAERKVCIHGGLPGPLTQKLYATITGIQRGTLPDPHGWMHPVT